MRIASALTCALLAVCGPTHAQDTTGEGARLAIEKLGQAALALDDARGASNRVAALTQTVKAYEDGLAVMRDGLRRAAIQERAIQADFDSRSGELSQLLGVLQSMEKSPAPLLLLHPNGPIGTARSGMLVSDITPELAERAATLKVSLDEITLLRSLQGNAVDALQDGLAAVQIARTELAQAISDRTDLPRRYVSDPNKMARLLNDSETLSAFASGLSQINTAGPAPQTADFAAAKGALSVPVAGRLLRQFNDPDAAGIERPGVLIAARPLSVVTTPWPATLRYRGPLLDYGNVIILEPQDGYLLVLAGLSDVYGEAGQVLDIGAPVGLMGGTTPNLGEFIENSVEGSGNTLSETLYIELRVGQSPVDPANWFALNKE